jgi:glutathione S-transferase
LTIHGVARSRATRNLWAAEELGLAYTHDPVGFGPDGCRSAAYMAINPNGHIPSLSDGGLVLWESLAINLYLAKKAGGPLAAATLAEDGLATMWSFWAAGEVEPNAITVVYSRVVLPPEERDEAKIPPALAAVEARLAVLNAHLSKHCHRIGGRFTIADLNVCCVLFYLRVVPEFLARFPAVKTYYDAATERPAFKRAFALRGE